MLYPRNFEEKTGFDKIRELLKGSCISQLGKDKVGAMRYTADFETIATSLNQTEEFKHICLYENEFPVSHYIDVRHVLTKIKVEGMYTTVEELFDMKRSLEAIKAILRFFELKKEEEYPNLRKLTGDVKMYPFVLDKINLIINKNGAVKDSASPELNSIRRSLLQKQGIISKISNDILARAKKEGWVEEDISVTIRDGRMLIPLPPAHKRKVKGVVYDESATGRTCYIEPVETIEANNEIRELEFAERREIIKILIEFANEARPYIEELEHAYEFMAEIDFLRAKARFAISINAEKPQLRDYPVTDLRMARHPLLYLTFKKEGKKVIPLNIEINNQDRIVLISGPNAGGKSVCLKTVGLLQFMLQCGMLIPANQTSVMGIFGNIFIDIGDEQSLENDLSTYSSHLKNMKFFTNKADKRTLFLIDEFGTGTEPLLGGAIAEAVLEELSYRKALGVITTHYTNLKHFASKHKNIVNAAMLFDTANLRPLFELEIGQPGSSYAFEIAGKIGLPKRVLRKATEKIGQEHIDYDKNLRKLEVERRELSNKLKKAKQQEIQLEDLLEKYNRETAQTIKQRKNILNLTHDQSKELLNGINKKIENTIQEIRKVSAEKEKTKQLRQELEKFAQEEKRKIDEENAKIEKRIEQIERRKSKKKKSKDGQKEEIVVIDPVIRVGDSVKLKKQDAVGEVIEIKDKELVVAFGSLQTLIHSKKVEKVSNNEVKRLERRTEGTIKSLGWDLSERKNNFISGLDVRGQRVDEALGRVMEYIDEAIVVEAREIKILHGTGTGALKQAIRDYLRTHDLVTKVYDERLELGGAGISIVQLDL